MIALERTIEAEYHKKHLKPDLPGSPTKQSQQPVGQAIEAEYHKKHLKPDLLGSPTKQSQQPVGQAIEAEYHKKHLKPDLPGSPTKQSQQPVGQAIEAEYHKKHLKPDLPGSPTEQSQKPPIFGDVTKMALSEVNGTQTSVRERLRESIKQVYKLPKQPSGVFKPEQQSNLDPVLLKPLDKMIEQTSIGCVPKEPSIFDPDSSKIYCKESVAVDKICSGSVTVNNSENDRQSYVECAFEQKTNFDPINFEKIFSHVSLTLAETSVTSEVQSSLLNKPEINNAQDNFEFDCRQKSVFDPSAREHCNKVTWTNVGSASRVNSSTPLKNTANEVKEKGLLSKKKSVSNPPSSENMVPSQINVAMAGSGASSVQHSPYKKPAKITKETFEHELKLQSHFNLANANLANSRNNSAVAMYVSGVEKPPPIKQKNKMKGSAQVFPKQSIFDPTNIDPFGQLIMAATATSSVSGAQNPQQKKQMTKMQDSTRVQPNESLYNPTSPEKFNQFNSTLAGINSANSRHDPLLKKQTNSMQDPARVMSDHSTLNPERFGPVDGNSSVHRMQNPALKLRSINIQGRFQFSPQHQSGSDSKKSIHTILSNPGISGVKKSPQKITKKFRCTKCTDVSKNKQTHICKFRLRYTCPFCAFLGSSRQAIRYHRKNDHKGQRYRPKGCVITYNPKKSGKKPQNVPLSKKQEFGKRIPQRKEGFEKQQLQIEEGFEKQIFQFATELTNIVNITNRSFSNPANNGRDVVEIDSDSDVECVPVTDSQGDDSCYIVEPGPGNLEFHAVEDNVVIIDPIKQEPDVEPEVDPLSGEVFIKSEPVEIKTENIYDFALVDHGRKQLPLSHVRGKGVALFSCDLCTYTSKYSHVIGQHKWRVHNVRGKKKEYVKKSLSVFGRLLKCDLCPYTTKLAKVLGSHKLRAHNVRGRKNMGLAPNSCSVRSLKPVERNAEVEQGVEENNILEEKKEVRETQKSQFPRYIGVPLNKRCPHCPFKTKFSGALTMHKKIKHSIEPEKNGNVEGRFVCEHCRNSYSNYANLIRHAKQQHNNEPKKNCPYCEETMFFDLELRRHIENQHPDQREKLKMKKQSTPFNIQQEHLPSMEQTVNRVERKREPLHSNEPSTDKYNCQFCSFQTEDLNVLGLHKQINHMKRNKNWQGGRFECEHCRNSYSNYANLIRHAKQRHIRKPKKYCPYCEKTMFFEFQLCRHVEKQHPDQWKKIKMKKQSIPYNVQQEHLPSMEQTVNQDERREPLHSNASSTDKYNCQFCPFQTEDFHIVGLHKQIKHMKRRKIGQGGVLKCLFCPEIYPFRSLMKRHVMTKHRGAWLKMERSTEQSNLRHDKQVDKKEFNRKIPSNRFNESNNSNSSWIDVKVEEGGQTEVAKKFCGTCDRFYNASYYRYHTCRKFIKCGICSYMSVSALKVHMHKAKVHMNQGVMKVEDSDDNKQDHLKQKRVVKETAENSFQELIKFETASSGSGSVPEMNDEEYVPSTMKKKVYLLDKPRKTCKKCQKSFHLSYFKYHRCLKLFKCSCCSYTDASLKKLRQHRRVYHSNLQNESGPTVSSEGHNLYDEIKLTSARQKTKIVKESIQSQLDVCETDEINVSPSESLGEEMIFCVECNSNHNPKYLWKYVCYKQSKIRCNMCSFVSSSKTYMARHKQKQHPINKFAAGSAQSSRKHKCQFCPLLFSNIRQLKNHLNLKHVEDRSQTKMKFSQDDLRLKLSQQSKPTWKPVTDIENTIFEDQSWGSQSDIYEASTSTASEGSLTNRKEKKTCRHCRKSYNRVYFPYHRCLLEKHTQSGKDTPSSNVTSQETQPPSNIVIEDTQQTSNIAVEGIQPPSNIAVEGIQPPSNIAVEGIQPPSNIAVEGIWSASNISVEDIQPPSNIAIEGIQTPSNIVVEGVQPPSNIAVKGIQPPSNIAVEDIQPPSNIAIEGIQTTSNIAVEDIQAPSNIVVEGVQPPSNIAVKGIQPPSNIAVEDIQPPSNIAIEGIQTTSNIAVEDIQAPSNIAVEDIQPPSNIAVKGTQPHSNIAVEGSLPLSNVASEEFTPPSNITKGSSEVLADKIKCEKCKIHFKTGAFQGHLCRPVLRCQKCSFRTRCKAEVTLHNKKHLMDDLVLTEESLYQCKTCQKKFASQSWFMHHKLNECKRKPLHQCSICRKKFYQEKNLELHVLQLHSNSNDKGKNDDERKDDNSEGDHPCPPP